MGTGSIFNDCDATYYKNWPTGTVYCDGSGNWKIASSSSVTAACTSVPCADVAAGAFTAGATQTITGGGAANDLTATLTGKCDTGYTKNWTGSNVTCDTTGSNSWKSDLAFFKTLSPDAACWSNCTGTCASLTTTPSGVDLTRATCAKNSLVAITGATCTTGTLYSSTNLQCVNGGVYSTSRVCSVTLAPDVASSNPTFSLRAVGFLVAASLVMVA